MTWFYKHEMKVSSKRPVIKLLHILFYGFIMGIIVDTIWTTVIWVVSSFYPAIENNQINFYQALILGYLIILYDHNLHIFRLMDQEK
jgi:hypothetical protein